MVVNTSWATAICVLVTLVTYDSAQQCAQCEDTALGEQMGNES